MAKAKGKGKERIERRVSTRVARAKHPAIQRRERLTTMLLAHDLEPPRRTTPKLHEEDWAILRLMALEGAVTNVAPALRAGAIHYLAKRPTPENLDLLAYLAQDGEDFYVRSHALVALGRTGLGVVAPLLAGRLTADERTERLAAEHGLAALAETAGIAAVRTALRAEALREPLSRIEASLAARATTERVARPRGVTVSIKRPG